MRILIAGIGGVGGYFGGLIADKYRDSDEINIYFLARGEHLKKIHEDGLKVITRDDVRIAYPRLATEDPTQLGTMDLILFCTKGYDLEETALSLAPCVSAGTIILPLLNGVDASDRLRQILPHADVIDGCVYIIARLKEPGVVENTGHIQQMFFGKQGVTDDRLIYFEKICREAGIEATYSERIQEVMWEKFIFISPLATATSYFNIPIGKLRDEHPGELYQLLIEVHALALAKGINLPRDAVESTVQKINAIPYEQTSSMHSDRMKGELRTEVESLTGYVVNEGRQYAVEVGTYEEIYRKLS